MALKARKKEEFKIHEQLHSNIRLLTLTYKQTEECTRVFAKDMFVKSNKAAFHHITHYLLDIVDPELTKTKIPWPLYDSKQEIRFRNELMHFVNELNSRYEYANIPTLMTSHLVSPGGYRFAKFMLKLSQLAMTVHLQRDSYEECAFLLPIRPNRNSNVNKNRIERLNRKTRQIEAATLHLLHEYEEYVGKAQGEAEEIVNDKKTVKERLIVLRNREITNNSIDTSAYLLELSHLNDSLSCSTTMLEKCVKVKELMSFMFHNDIVLRFSRDSVNVPDDVLKIVCVDSNIDLISYFDTLNTLLSVIRLKQPRLSSFFVDNKLLTSSETNKWLLMFCKAYEELIENSLKLSSFIKNNVPNYRPEPSKSSDSDEILAVPLEDSPH